MVSFIRRKSENLKIQTWTDEQIACYIGEKVKNGECIYLHNGESPLGLVFFSLLSESQIYIEQIWCENKRSLRVFLHVLRQNFPTVTDIRAWHQRRGRTINFNVNQFIRIYGR